MAFLVSGNAILLLVGVFAWLRHERSVDYIAPDKGVKPKVYRILERAIARIFGGSKAVRCTIFALDASERDAEVLMPIARVGWGRASRNSSVRFRKGEGLAGEAWERPSSIVVAYLGSNVDVSTPREVHESLFTLRPETARNLSDEQLMVRASIAVHLQSVGGQFRGVLCIDSKDASLVPDTEECPDFWLRIDQLGTALAAALESNGEANLHDQELGSSDDSRLMQLRVA